MPEQFFSDHSLLEQICHDKRAHIKRQKIAIPFDELRRRADNAPSVRPFIKALMDHRASGRYGLITEIKKASPSKGLLRRHFDPAEIARAYAQAGATCLSIVTDKTYFQGTDLDLVTARTVCDLAVLRKDFLLDPYQIVESRSLGADCILLILAILDDLTACRLIKSATDYDMDVLIEVHNEFDLERALQLPVKLIGINNRNLDTLSIDLTITERLAPQVPEDRLVISESGLSTYTDLERMSRVGVTCFLIGHSLLQQDDVTTAVQNLLGARATTKQDTHQ